MTDGPVPFLIPPRTSYYGGGVLLIYRIGYIPSQLILSGNAHTDHPEVKFPNLLCNSQANIFDDHTELYSKIA